MTIIERSIEIRRVPAEVFTAITDLARLPDWATIVVETHDLPNRPLQNGAAFRQTIRVAGRALECDWRVAER